MKLNIWKIRKASEKPTNTLRTLLLGREPGELQQFGSMAMIPLFGPAAEGQFAPPETALALTKVHTYGVMQLENRSGKPTIVPMHMGYLQRGAQNHAMCTAGVLGPGKSHVYKDACCIQQAQGGYIHEADERFIFLPLPLRKRAFELRGKEEYGKLWNDITSFNEKLGLKNRGHLDEMKQHHQSDLLQTTYRLELAPGQTGAVFLQNGRIVGVEAAPDAAFYEQLHPQLVMYCYGPLRLLQNDGDPARIILKADSIDELSSVYERVCARRREMCRAKLDTFLETAISTDRDAKVDDWRVLNVFAKRYQGQAVMQDDKPVYLSLFAA